MAEELATLDDGDQLISDLENMSSDDIAKKLAEPPDQEVAEEQEELTNDDSTEAIEAEETESEEADEESEELAEESAEEPTRDPTKEKLEQDNQRLMEMLQAMVKQKEPLKEQAKPLTPEEKIEAFAQDPDAYISGLIRPYKDELKRLERRSVVESARLNEDYVRLEPTIDKLKKAYPTLDDLDPGKHEEVYFLIAKGMEALSKVNEVKKSDNARKQKRLKAKKEAAAMPTAKKKVSPSSKQKPVEQMSLDELEKYIKAQSA